MFSDHDETSPSIAAVSSPLVARKLLWHYYLCNIHTSVFCNIHVQ